jgi:arsenite methyltransferase
MKTTTPNTVHQAVQEHYGNLARQNSSCCGSDSMDNSKSGSCCSSSAGSENINDLYPQELLSTLPREISGFTAGSGDPISLAELQAGETVLDLGSGGGLDCFLAAKKVGEGGHVIGVDMTPEMLERANLNKARIGSTNVEFRQGYLEALPVVDNSIDVIISNCVINLSPDKHKVFGEMFRALKPGGRIAVSDVIANRPLPREGSKDQEDWCGCISGAMTDQSFIDELEKAGFVDAHLEPDLESTTRSFESRQRKMPVNLSKKQLLEDIHRWQACERTMVIPFKITARKPENVK